MITNHAKDLRQMLHHTFKMNQPFELSEDVIMVFNGIIPHISPDHDVL